MSEKKPRHPKSKGPMSPELKKRWLKALAETEAEKESIMERGRAVFAAHKSSREIIGRLKAERERRGLSLADMLERTGMSREALSKLENNQTPNPTVLTLSRYAAAVGLELLFSTKKARA